MSPDMIKSHCNACGRETNHHVLHEERRTGREPYADDEYFDWWEHYRTLRCAGCDTISLRIDSTDSRFEDDDGSPKIFTRCFPPRIFRPKPIWHSDPALFLTCPPEIKELLDELYVCLQNDCVRAAAMAARALLEHVFVDTCGDQGTFKKNVEAFQNAGHLSDTQRQLLETALNAGHAAIHRSFKPSKDDLVTVVSMVESLVELLYVQKHRVEQLRKRIPPRKSS
jgi:hypothetical protein